MKYQETRSGVAPNARRQAHADQTTKRARLASLNQSAWELRWSDRPKSKTLALEAKELATELNDSAELAQSLVTFSIAIFREDDIQAALAAGEEAYQLTDALPKSTRQNLLLRAVNFLIGVHYRLGNYAVALDLYLKHLDEITSLDAKQDKANLFNNLSGIYGALGDYTMAISMLEQTIHIRRETNDHQGLASALLNMGNVYLRQRRFEDALHIYNESLQCAQKANLNREQGAAYYAIGNVYAEQEQYEEAVANFEKALSITTAERDENNRAFTLQAIGKIYAKKVFSKFNIDTAITLLNDALKEAESLQNKRAVYSILKELAIAYESAGKFEEALRYERAYRDLRDELIGEEQQKRTQSLKILHQTEQAKKDAELERLKNIELADALKKVEEANAFKTELLGIAAHDLKNPLQVIQGFAALIEESGADQQAKQYSQTIQASSARMLKLIKELLETAALDSGKLDLNKIPVNLADLLRAVAEHNRPNAEKKSQTIELELEENAIVEIDVERMREVFENLVSNAVKYSQSGKRIVVGSRRSELGIVAFVKDEGQGLTEEDKQKLFGKFQRLSARPTGGESSTGLGLSIVKQLVELHGGKVWAESDGKDKGTTFFVELPTMKGQRHISEKEHTKRSRSPGKAVQRSATVTRKKSKQKKIRVAVVEDLIEFRDSMVSLLSNAEGIEFMGEYGSVEDALIAMPQVDIVLMDIGLPGISGIDAIAKVKEKFSETQLLMLTVFNDDKHISRAMMAGASGYLLKNTPHPQILEAIAQVYDGGMPISAGIAKRIIRLYQQYAPSENSSASLTKREKEILSLLVKGLSFAQISDKLFISFNTVVNHMRKVYEKMHVHSKSEVVAKAIREGLV
jgi:signal transduction histidine kinase/DNA-binding NarL/FixJ family response regulator